MPRGTQLTIRLASLADASAIASTHVDSWRETYAGVVPPPMLSSLSVDKRTAMWTRIMSGPATTGSSNVYVAEVDREIVGFGSCGAQRTQNLAAKGYDGEVSAIYVLNEFQRRAIGTRLLYVMATDLRDRGFAAASLWVLRDNTPARRYYERYGAKTIGEKEDVRPDGILVEVAYGWLDLMRLVQLTAVGL